MLTAQVCAAFAWFGGKYGTGWAPPGEDSVYWTWGLSFLRGTHNSLNLLTYLPTPGVTDPGPAGRAAVAGVAALMVVALVGAAAYWVPRRPSLWADVGHGTMTVYALHRCLVPLVKTMFMRVPFLVRLDAFFGIPFFLGLQYFLAIVAPRCFLSVARRLRKDCAPEHQYAPVLLDDKRDLNC